ncbi:MAG TPA: fluoride efflux transporter CrcB [Acidimicrobiales bacterium]|nr:fluoride efflux transporter CrcB [Acidimicrobiales bacterium]
MTPLSRRAARARRRYPEPVDPDLVPSRPGRRPAWQRPGILAAVGVGGVVGACARYELGLAMPYRHGAFPTSTFLINVTGSFALGFLLTLMVERWRPNEYVRPLVATGVIGAYTTWSTYMTDADNLVRDGHPGVAAAYVVASLAAGLAAVYAGTMLGRGRMPRFVKRGED